MKVKKESILNLIISSLSNGDYPTKIAKDNNLSKEKVFYYIRELKKKGLIRKVGYGVWETSVKSTKVAKSVRGHAFMWKIRIPKKINWKSVLEKKKINHKIIYKGTPSIMFKDRKVWLGKKNIIIYEPESFFGINSIETRKQAIERLLEVLIPLESKLGVNLQEDGQYHFKVSRHHYSLMKNSLAVQCNKEGMKINVSNDKGMWFIIDNSFNLDEAETIHPKTALTDNLGIQKYFNEHKETKFEVTPKFLLESIKGLTSSQQNMNNLLMGFAKNIDSHTKSIKTLAGALPQLVQVLKEVKEENQQLKQRKLSEFF